MIIEGLVILLGAAIVVAARIFVLARRRPVRVKLRYEGGDQAYIERPPGTLHFDIRGNTLYVTDSREWRKVGDE